MAQISLKEAVGNIRSGHHRLVDIANNLGGGTTDHDVAKSLRNLRCTRVIFGNAELLQVRSKVCRGCAYNSNCPRK